MVPALSTASRCIQHACFSKDLLSELSVQRPPGHEVDGPPEQLAQIIFEIEQVEAEVGIGCEDVQDIDFAAFQVSVPGAGFEPARSLRDPRGLSRG